MAKQMTDEAMEKLKLAPLMGGMFANSRPKIGDGLLGGLPSAMWDIGNQFRDQGILPPIQQLDTSTPPSAPISEAPPEVIEAAAEEPFRPKHQITDSTVGYRPIDYSRRYKDMFNHSRGYAEGGIVTQDLAQYGRGNDSEIAHVSPGEMMVPPEMMARHPDLQKHLYQAYLDEGMDPRQFKVGSGITSLNPTTGKAEFGFFKKLFKAAAPVVGYALGGAAGAAIGGALAGASDGGGLKGALKGGAIGYVGGSLAQGGAFGDTIAGYSGGGIGGVGAFGTEWSGPVGNWGSKGVSDSIVRHGGIGNAWQNLGKKATSSPMLAMAALGALSEEPDDGGGTPYVPNDQPGDPFNIDRPDLNGSGDYKNHAITDATAGYAPGATDYKAVTMPYNSADYVKTPVIKPTPLILNNPNLTPEELMEYYRPKAYKAQGGMINDGTTGTADDVPIMASKGEFVMTADAVRNAGQGDPRVGAKKLYNLMYNLEGAR